MIDKTSWWLFVGLLPIVFWLLPMRIRPALLAAASIALLVALSPLDMLIMLVIGCFVYACFAFPDTVAIRAVTAVFARLALAGRATGPVAMALFYLFWFKYLLPISTAMGFSPRAAMIAVPLGISYFTFKLINYALENSRGLLPAHGFADFLSWLFLVPTFSAGPIEPFDHYLANREVRFQSIFIVEGGTRIVKGLVKKFVLGDAVIWACNALAGKDLVAFAHSDATSAGATWAFLLLSVLSGYLDFSGYSDIAIGASRLFGLRIIENFNYPFLATNLGEFWRRWHMSLVNWCRGYIYMPLVGLTRNPYVTVTVTFTLIGLWHAGSLLWITWGLWHGLGQVGMQKWVRFAQRRKIKFFRTSAGTAVGWSMTMGYVALGDAFVVMYHEGAYLDAWRILGRAFGL